jgi:hypothetical protein
MSAIAAVIALIPISNSKLHLRLSFISGSLKIVDDSGSLCISKLSFSLSNLPGWMQIPPAVFRHVVYFFVD